MPRLVAQYGLPQAFFVVCILFDISMSSFEQRSRQRALFTMGRRGSSTFCALCCAHVTRHFSWRLGSFGDESYLTALHHGVPILSIESRGTGWLSAAAACEVMSTRRALWPWVCFRAARRASCAGCGEQPSKATHARPPAVNRRSVRGCWRGMRSASFCTCRRASDEPFGQTVGEFDGLWWEGRWHGQRAPFAAPALVHSLGGDCLAGFCWERVLGEVLKLEIKSRQM